MLIAGSYGKPSNSSLTVWFLQMALQLPVSAMGGNTNAQIDTGILVRFNVDYSGLRPDVVRIGQDYDDHERRSQDHPFYPKQRDSKRSIGYDKRECRIHYKNQTETRKSNP